VGGDPLLSGDGRNWGDDALLTILAAVPTNRLVWGLTNLGGAAVELGYWRAARVYIANPQLGDYTIAAERLIAVGRSRQRQSWSEASSIRPT
jgi:hypothetical protein